MHESHVLSPPNFSLAPQDIHLWQLDMGSLNEARIAQAAEPVCSPDEWQRAQRFRLGPTQHLATRLLLRQLLGAYSGLAPAALSFAQHPQGKPYVLQVPLAFNLSHSGNTAILAISQERLLGVDVEQWQRPRNYLALAEHFFAPQESAWLRSLTEAEQAIQFYRLWTLKEALLKAQGCGIANNLAQLCFVATDTQLQLHPAARLNGQPLAAHHWQLHQWQLAPNTCLALAAASTQPVSIRWHSANDWQDFAELGSAN